MSPPYIILYDMTTLYLYYPITCNQNASKVIPNWLGQIKKNNTDRYLLLNTVFDDKGQSIAAVKN